MSKYSIEDSTLTGIADKIREKNYSSASMTPSEMIDAIDGLTYTLDMDIDVECTAEDWVRPPEYPDLTSIELADDFDGVYLTYDLRKTPGYGWVGLYASLNNNPQIAALILERGHLEDNEFVVDERFMGGSTGYNSGYYFRVPLDEANGEVQLWKFYSFDKIYRVAFVTNTTTTADNYENSMQPCVERYGQLKYAKNFDSSSGNASTSLSYTTRWLCRDDVKNVVSATSMSATFKYSRSLKVLKMDGWDTSKVTNFNSCFAECYNLKSIPLKNISTQNATNLGSMFDNCRALNHVDISHFNIDKVTTMATMFRNCYALDDLEMSSLTGVGKLTTITSLFNGCRRLEDIERNIKNLNVSNVTTMSSAFAGCNRLKKIDLRNWDVGSVTTIESLFDYAYELTVADLSGWDVSKVTMTRYTFRGCNQLRELNLTGWNLDKVTNAAAMFLDCYSIKEVPVIRWNISALTSASSLFQNCRSITSVTLENWDVPNVLTTVASMFSGCWSLKSLHLPDMEFTVPVSINSFIENCWSLTDLDISGWKLEQITAIASFFSYCRSLDEVIIDDWTVNNPNLTAKNTINYVFGYMYNCKKIKVTFPMVLDNGNMSTIISSDTPLKYLDLSAWDLSGATNTTNIANCYILEDCYPPDLPPFNITCADAYMITRESLLRVIDKLPTTATARTLTLGTRNKNKLTAEEIAVATAKGWTVA